MNSAASRSSWSLLGALGACAVVSAAFALGELPAQAAFAALFAVGVVLALLAALEIRADRRLGPPSRGPYTDFKLYGRLLREARPYWGHIAAFSLVSLLTAPLALLTPLPLMIAVDSAINSKPLADFVEPLVPASVARSPTGILFLAVGLLVGVAFLRHVQELVGSVLRAYVGEKLLLRFRTQLFSHVQRLSLGYHDVKGTADSTYRIQYDAIAIQTIAVDGVIPFVTAAFTLAGMIYVTAALDLELALVALGVSPLLLALTLIYRRRIRPRYKAIKMVESSALSVVQEVLTGLRVVKAFGQEDREEDRFVTRSSEGVRARIKVALANGIFALLVGLTIAAGTAAVLYIGVRDVRSGALSLGALLLIMGYLTQLYEPLKTISKKAASLQSAFASAERAFALLDEAPDVAERPGAGALERAAGAIEFRDVSFAYDGERPVLRDVSLELRPGARLGIAGATGAGKTTLVSLLTRFYDPTEGAILLDGVDLRDYDLADLRRQFAIVLQEPVLFSTTIAENIAYARPEAGHEEIVAAAKAANAHDFITGLPDGYDTQVGERGMRLSGGERQRISLARAFLKDAPILILDEPTSSVDVKTEATIMKAMNRLMKGRTTLMIAHRLSTLEECETRIELSDGRLVSSVDRERGEPEDTARHPAVVAWREISPDGRLPNEVETLKETKKMGAYRLVAAAPDGANVIAKRSRREPAQNERLVYERILPRLPMRSLRLYGARDAADFTWLFLEDAAGATYTRHSAYHRGLAARWLGDLHLYGAAVAGDQPLLERGPVFYGEFMASARELIARSRTNPELTAEHHGTLNGLLEQFDSVETHWDALSALCAEGPQTFVHGDIKNSNLCVVGAGRESQVVAFDWALAGWGSPAADLSLFARESARPELAEYHALVRKGWPELSLADLRELAEVGVVLRWIATAYWSSRSLPYPWPEKAMWSLRKCRDALAESLAEAAWASPVARR